MDTSIQKRMTLSIDFDLHTDGDDEFKRELVMLMIENVKELKEALHQAYTHGKINLFRECCHKVMPTLNILDHKEFTELAVELKLEPVEASKMNIVTVFNQLCDFIITSLKNEIK